MSYLLLLLVEDIVFILDDLSRVGSWEELIALPSFTKIVIYASILLVIIISTVFHFVMYRIMRPIALFIMARHAGFRHAWVAFVPYGTYYLEFVLPIREFNVLNWVKTDKRETIAWTYIANDLLNPIISSILGMIPFLSTILQWAYSLFFVLWKWRKIYDLLITFGFKKSAMTWSILATLYKPLYVVLLFIMCDKEPNYGWKRFDFPIMIDYDGNLVEY